MSPRFYFDGFDVWAVSDRVQAYANWAGETLLLASNQQEEFVACTDALTAAVTIP